MAEKIALADERGGSADGWKKITVTFFSVEWKKLWLVSHKLQKKQVLKVPRKMRKRTFLDMLPFVACLRNIFRRSKHFVILYIILRYMLWLFSNFKRNIFGWKVPKHGPSVLPTMDFWFLRYNRNIRFSTEYFWLKSMQPYNFIALVFYTFSHLKWAF